MTKEQLKSKVEELEKELAQFKKELDEKDKSPYCKRVVFQKYYFATPTGDISVRDETMSLPDKMFYDNANYFSDKSFAKKVVAEQILTNLLRKYTYEHGWSDDLWDNHTVPKYEIYYSHADGCFRTAHCYLARSVNLIHFIDDVTAENAIQKVVIPFVKEHPELGYELKD